MTAVLVTVKLILLSGVAHTYVHEHNKSIDWFVENTLLKYAR